MSKLYVNEIVEATSGAGVAIPGHVIQVVSATSTSTATTTSTSFVSTGFSASITPTSTTNKVMVMVSGGMEGCAGGSGSEVTMWKVYRNGSSIEGSSYGKRLYLTPNVYSILDIKHLDSPASTSAQTYTLYYARFAGSGTASWNRDGGQTVTMTLMEIAQ